MSGKKRLPQVNETEQFRRATTTVEQLEAEYAGTQPSGELPSQWKDGRSGTSVAGKPVQVHAPSPEDIHAFGSPRAQTCGQCRYFDLENGRKEIVHQRFGEKLVKEMEWKLKHLGADVDAIGLCGASGGEMAVTFVSGACDQFRPRGV